MNITTQVTQTSRSEVEWMARVNLAATFRILAYDNMSDLANGAVAAWVPDQLDHCLVHPYGLFWEEATASAMIKIGPDERPVNPGSPWLNDGVQNLCKWIFGSRPETMYVIRGHEEEMMAV